MATFKGIGYDSTNARTRTGDADDTIQFAGDVVVDGNQIIDGNLNVNGTIVSTDEQQVLVQDNFLDLNFGYTTASYEQTGLTFNYQAVSGVTIDTTGNTLTFTAADGATARAKVVAATASGIPASTFSDGDIIQLNGTTNGDNDGIYVVHTNATAGTIEIKSSNLTTPDTINAKFARDDFDAEAESTADSLTIFKVNLMALRSSSTGTLEQQNGATDSSFSSYTAVGGQQTMQDTYGNGATITTASNTDIDLNLASGNLVVDQGTFQLGTTTATNFQMNRGTFNVGVTNAVSEFIVSCDGNSGGDVLFSASDAAGSIQLEVNSTTILEAKDAALDLNTDVDFGKASGSAQVLKRTSVADGDDLTIQLAGANNASIILDNVAGTGTDAIKLDAQAGGFDIAGELASKILVTTGDLEVGTFTSGDLTLSTTTAGDIIANAAEGIDMDAGGAFDLLAGGTFSIDGTGASNVSATSGNLTVSTITSGTLSLQSAGAFDIDGSSASTMTVTGANLDIATATSGNVTVSSVGELRLDSDDALFLQMDANATTNKVLQIQANNAGTGQGNIQVDADNNIFCQIAGTNVLEIASASIIASQILQASNSAGLKFGTSGQVVTEIDTDTAFASASDSALATQLAIKTYVDNQIPSVDQDLNIQGDTGSGAINLATETLDIAGGTNITSVFTDGSSTMTLNLDATITLTEVNATNIDAGNLRANDGTAAITITDSTGAVALTTETTVGNNNNLVIDGENGGGLAAISGLDVQNGVNEFDLVYIASGGYQQADASAIASAFVVGVSLEDASGGAVSSGKVAFSGVTAVDIPTGTPAVGSRIYLSETAGKATLTAPTTAGSVVFQIGFVTSATAISGTVFPIVFQPQFIIEN